MVCYQIFERFFYSSIGDGGENPEPQHWRMLHRHYLHPHYSSSILDETINRPNNAIQSAINRAIAGKAPTSIMIPGPRL